MCICICTVIIPNRNKHRKKQQKTKLGWPWPSLWSWNWTSHAQLNWCPAGKMNIYYSVTTTLTLWPWYSKLTQTWSRCTRYQKWSFPCKLKVIVWIDTDRQKDRQIDAHTHLLHLHYRLDFTLPLFWTEPALYKKGDHMIHHLGLSKGTKDIIRCLRWWYLVTIPDY